MLTATMNHTLEKAVQKLASLSEERQLYAAQVIEQIAAAGAGVYTLSAEERQLVEEGLADLDAGRVVADEDMQAFWSRNRR